MKQKYGLDIPGPSIIKWIESVLYKSQLADEMVESEIRDSDIRLIAT